MGNLGLKDIFLPDEKIDKIISLLTNTAKKQIIFQGPPGTGKTFISKRISKYLAGTEERTEIIQFHPSYSYEDFIEGYRPSKDKDGFTLTPGIFKSFCIKALGKKNKFVIVIDEINRGNLSKIFGELLYLLEYRNEEVKLTYSSNMFKIPENIYLIGTMNTTDRSLAIMDYALRRRFYFIDLKCELEYLKKWLDANGCQINSSELIEKLKKLNDTISEEMYSSDFEIGHSYFMKKNLNAEMLENAIEFEIKPLIAEYLFDKKDKVDSMIKLLS